MSRRANPAVVGGFVVGALALLVAGVMVFGSGALLREQFPVVAFFSGNVRGLQEGSAVEFRGVRVGTVTRIRLLLDPESRELFIPVHMELDPRSIGLVGTSREVSIEGAAAFLDELVGQGLRARLDLKSFVTGQLAVGLDMHADTAPDRVGGIADVYELPTVPSTLDRVTAVLQDLPLQDIAARLLETLEGIDRLMRDEHLAAVLRDAAATAAGARRLVAEIDASAGPAIEDSRATLREARETLAALRTSTDATLAGYRVLADKAVRHLDDLSAGLDTALGEVAGIRASLDARIAPVAESAVATLDEARGALANARDLLEAGSRTRYNLDRTLEELAAAARSLRIMVDYLERNPDALIKGRRQ